jgi:uncharacterized protein YkwD
MRKPSKGVTSIVAVLVLTAVAGGVLSRSLLHSGATRAPATQGNVLMLFNQIRTAHGLHPLRGDTRLADAATSHSVDMLRRGYFAHDGPQGTFSVRIRRYVRSGSEAAEILSFGGGVYATPAGMVKAWMASPAHRRIILLPELRSVGFGVATGTYHGSTGVAMATADFSSS